MLGLTRRRALAAAAVLSCNAARPVKASPYLASGAAFIQTGGRFQQMSLMRRTANIIMSHSGLPHLCHRRRVQLFMSTEAESSSAALVDGDFNDGEVVQDSEAPSGGDSRSSRLLNSLTKGVSKALKATRQSTRRMPRSRENWTRQKVSKRP